MTILIALVVINLMLTIGVIMYLRGFYFWVRLDMDKGIPEIWVYHSPYYGTNILWKIFKNVYKRRNET